MFEITFSSVSDALIEESNFSKASFVAGILKCYLVCNSWQILFVVQTMFFPIGIVSTSEADESSDVVSNPPIVPYCA
mgnify:CR=1 FL=1